MHSPASSTVAAWMLMFLLLRGSTFWVSALRSTNQPNAEYPKPKNTSPSAEPCADREIHSLRFSHNAVMITRKKRSPAALTEPLPPNENNHTIADLHAKEFKPDFGSEFLPDDRCGINASSCFLFSSVTKCGVTSGGHCNCDALCVLYGDCCEDFAAVCPDVHSQALASFGSWIPPEVTCLPQVKAKMVTGCPSSDHALHANCTKGVKVNDADLMPVLDSDSGIDYVNSFCAICNGANGSNLIPWSLILNLESQTETMNLSDSEELQPFERALNGDATNRHGKVVISWLPPAGKVKRGCVLDVVQSCPDTLPANNSLVLACKNAISYVQSSQKDAQVFANRHCLLCNGLRSCIRPQHNHYQPERGGGFSLLVQWQHPSKNKNVTLSNMHPSVNSAWSTAGCVRVNSSKQCRVTECLPNHDLRQGNCHPSPVNYLYFVFLQIIGDHDIFGLKNQNGMLDREFNCNCSEEEITLKACNFPESRVNFSHKLWEVIATSLGHVYTNANLTVCTTSFIDFDGNWTMKLTVNFTTTSTGGFQLFTAQRDAKEAIKFFILSFMRKEKASNDTAVILCTRSTPGGMAMRCVPKETLQVTQGDALPDSVIRNGATVVPGIHANHAQVKKATPFYLCMFYLSLTGLSYHQSIF